MANGGLLSNIDKKSIKEFRNDFFGILRIAKEIDRSFSVNNPDADIYMKKFQSLIQTFNKKYKILNLKLTRRTDRIELKILIDEKNLKELFANSASKISGLQSIGVSNYTDAPISNAEQFTNEMEKIKEKLYIYYVMPNSGPSKLFFCYDSKSKKIELSYDEDIESEPSAEFQIAAYYALSKGCNNKIKIEQEASTLGFSLWPDHSTKKRYFEKFDPHFSE